MHLFPLYRTRRECYRSWLATQIFVAVLGASSYTYAEATWTQGLPDWLGSHVRALGFFKGLPRAIAPDFVPGKKIRQLCSLCYRKEVESLDLKIILLPV